MILSNADIVLVIGEGDLSIIPDPGGNPDAPPFNTSAIDLRLGRTLQIPRTGPYSHSLQAPFDAEFIRRNSDEVNLETVHDWLLRPHTFVIGQTLETVSFPVREGRPLYSARVEGKSSR